ncbi:NADAR family protein [Spirillospora sp. CA-255316]
MTRNRTYRIVDGERIEGTWRPVFVHNFDYHLTDLKIFADGAIWCWEWLDLDGLRAKLESGRIATAIEPGARASAHHVGAWRFDDFRTSLTPEMLLGEVADEIDRLNDRPDSTGRCRQALDRYLETRTEEDRQALRTAYLDIPEHLRVYALGDMDNKDRPLAVLCTSLGEPLLANRTPGSPPIVTERMRDYAFAYFAERTRAEQAFPPRTPSDDPETPPTALHISQTVYPSGWPTRPGPHYLQNEYPAPIEIGSTTYPTVTHAYWALSTTDTSLREQIRQADRPFDAERLARDAPRDPSWPETRAAVMATLLRAKFRQHPHLADYLLSTRGRIHYSGTGSTYWTAAGRNWTGRLLELIRSEHMIEHMFD